MQKIVKSAVFLDFLDFQSNFKRLKNNLYKLYIFEK